MVTLPVTRLYDREALSQIIHMGGVRAPQTLSSNHHQKLPCADTSRGADTYCRVPCVGVKNLSQRKAEQDRSQTPDLRVLSSEDFVTSVVGGLAVP